MNLPRLSHRQSGENQALVGFPRIPILANLSLSTKLILLVVVPLALTLAVTLPLTVTGLNRLASVTSTEQLEEEVHLIEEQFEDDLNGSADEIAKEPFLLTATRDSNGPMIISNLLSTRIRLGLQHLQVVDAQGAVIGQEQQSGGDFSQSEIQELQQLGLAELEFVSIVQSPDGWLLAAVRPLKDSEGLIGAITVGRLIDSEVLARLNFERSDPLLMVFDEAGNVVASSWSFADDSELTRIKPDDKMVAMAKAGQVSLGMVELGKSEHRTAYAPVVLRDSIQGIFGMALTTSPVVGLRDQLIANHVMVTAALVLLVLGVGYVVTRTITRRILRLRDGAVEIGNGNLSARIEESANDEMGTLAREFNRMADSLSEKNSQLEQANRNLEMRVFERTEELEQANAQLLEAQSQLVRTEKLAAIGELSAGVAHDLRNPLGAIRNGVFFLKARRTKSDRLTTDPKVAEFLSVIDERITKCDKIIGDLISFTRISNPTYSAVTLSDVLESTLWAIETPNGISIIRDYGDEPVEAQADLNQLIRVFTNLTINALEAMPDGGELTIGMRRAGTMAEVTFKDTGTGVSLEELEKIFDPLYTTKIQGTGLGLAVCQEIVAKHNGRIDFFSDVGIGTTFTVRLPLNVGETVSAAVQ